MDGSPPERLLVRDWDFGSSSIFWGGVMGNVVGGLVAGLGRAPGSIGSVGLGGKCTIVKALALYPWKLGASDSL